MNLETNAPQLVFAPTRWNLGEAPATYDLAVEIGCTAFVTGPLMRIGRAAAEWEQLACGAEEWQAAVAALQTHAQSRRAPIGLSIYPWDILTEMGKRLEQPQAMLLVVPNGKVTAPGARGRGGPAAAAVISSRGYE